MGGFAENFPVHEASVQKSKEKKTGGKLGAPGRQRTLDWGKDLVDKAKKLLEEFKLAKSVNDLPKDNVLRDHIKKLDTKCESIGDRCGSVDEERVHDQPCVIAGAAASRKAPAVRRSSGERHVDVRACAAAAWIGMAPSREAHCGLMARRYGSTGHRKQQGERATGRHW